MSAPLRGPPVAPALLPALCPHPCHWRGPPSSLQCFQWSQVGWHVHLSACVFTSAWWGCVDTRRSEGPTGKRQEASNFGCHHSCWQDHSCQEGRTPCPCEMVPGKDEQLWGPCCLSAVPLCPPPGPANRYICTSPAEGETLLFQLHGTHTSGVPTRPLKSRAFPGRQMKGR